MGRVKADEAAMAAKECVELCGLIGFEDAFAAIIRRVCKPDLPDANYVVARLRWWLNDINHKAPEQLSFIYVCKLAKDLHDALSKQPGRMGRPERQKQ